MERRSRIIRSIWAACLLIAAANHARILLQHGVLWNYGGVAWPSAAYWTSLTMLDPLAALLLFMRPRIGIVMTIALILTNVVHNLAVTAQHAPPGAFLERAVHPITVSQITFMLFVLATAHPAWQCLRKSSRSER